MRFSFIKALIRPKIPNLRISGKDPQVICHIIIDIFIIIDCRVNYLPPKLIIVSCSII